MNNSQVAHVWANETKPQGNGSNFYFRGPTLYSYGPHFVVGRIVRNRKGKRAYILNSSRYSMSTGRHQSYAARAIATGEIEFSVANPAGDHDTNRADYKARIAASLANVPGARSARTLRDAIDTASSLANEYNRYSAFYSLRGRVKVPQLNAADRARLTLYTGREATREANRDARWAAERKAREAAELLTEAERREKFRNGEPRFGRIGGPCMLRYNDGLARFETSQGADITRESGLAMIRFIALNYHSGRTYDMGGQAVSADGFTLRSITAEAVTIGCHVIPMSEVAAMAGLFNVEFPA